MKWVILALFIAPDGTERVAQVTDYVFYRAAACESFLVGSPGIFGIDPQIDRVWCAEIPTRSRRR